METLFLELIQVSLGQRVLLSHTPTEEEWKRLYDMAEKHALLGICFAGVKSLFAHEQRPSQQLLLQWYSVSQYIEQRNELLNSQCVKLQRNITKDGWQSCILKGQGNTILYPKEISSLRQSGDIDIWLNGEREKIIEYVNKIYPTDEITPMHIHLHVFQETEVEVHFTPSQLANRVKNRKLQKWFWEQRDAQMVNSVPFGKKTLIIPTSQFNVVYQMLHIYKHLFAEGIGLRQLMDYYYVLIHAHLGEEQLSEVKKTITDFGLDRFAGALMWVLQKCFCLSPSLVIWKPNQKEGEFILGEIFQMGNFGHSDERFRLNKNDTHLKRYLFYSYSKFRFITHYPCETLWQPVDTFITFFKNKQLQRAAHKYHVTQK